MDFVIGLSYCFLIVGLAILVWRIAFYGISITVNNVNNRIEK
jgi:hypothetical protein